MSQFFNSKVFNPEVFGKYIENIPNVKKSELAKSNALGSNENARKALSEQTGSYYARVPYYGRISADTSQNNNGATNIQSSKLNTFDQGFVVASRMDSWDEKSFSKNITAGVDFMDNVGKQIADYKIQVVQKIMLKMLEGIYSMDTTADTVRGHAAKDFIEKHTYDSSNVTGVSPTALNTAIQKACGDNKSIIKLAIMDSTTATDLENQNLLNMLKYTDKDGITRDLTLGTWNGRLVLVDDDMPVTIAEATYAKTSDAALVPGKKYFTRSGSAGHYVYTEVETPDVTDIGSYYEITSGGYEVHTTYLLGEGSIVVDPIPDSVPYEMHRDPLVNGGEDYLIVRDRYICGFESFSYEQTSGSNVSATNEDLANGEHWAVIHNATEAIPTKSIAIARLFTRGNN